MQLYTDDSIITSSWFGYTLCRVLTKWLQWKIRDGDAKIKLSCDHFVTNCVTLTSFCSVFVMNKLFLLVCSMHMLFLQTRCLGLAGVRANFNFTKFCVRSTIWILS